MRLRASHLLFAVLLLSGIVAFSGCKAIKKLLPADEITDPEVESPEWVIQEAMKAAMEKDTNVGWKRMRKVLHTQIIGSRGAESSYRTLNFEAFHRKVHLFLEDPTKPVFHIDYIEEPREDERKIFVVNKGSEMPTPCNLKRDPAQDNKWRIFQCGL